MSAWFWRTSIGFYQRWISPYKGYRCAHATYHGGHSCSHVIRDILVDQGLIRGWPQVRQRFADCRSAYEALKQRRLAMAAQQGQGPQSKQSRRRDAGGSEGSSACCDLGCLPDNACETFNCCRGGSRFCDGGPGCDCDLPCI
ncbi:membrane protein insertion efficiency factor YidD [Chitinimonas lacunae]|uniref:Membrane protein insertion efficiency factor YidD n=1 Tax=Chitinimonas lacunae TaxID=1963018 RepID=A0ABV8MXA5_9NEIS